MSGEDLKSFVGGESPLVSVIIPSFQKAHYLRETVRSVLAQEYEHLEIIIVNDGSSDDTSDVARSLIREHPTRAIRLIERENGGVSAARNTAIDAARGRVLVNLDGDDLMGPGFIRKALERIRGEGANLVTCQVELFGDECGSWEPQPYDEFVSRYSNIIPALVMYDKELWRKVEGYRCAFPFNEDWDFFLRCQRAGLVVSRIEEPLFRYRVVADGLAFQYIKDSGHKSIALVMIANQDLYPVEEIISAHKFFGTVPDAWADRLRRQDAQHSREWLLKFWLGLIDLGRGNVDAARSLLGKAGELTGWGEWQPIYVLGSMLEADGDAVKAAMFYHRCRVLRPDTRRFVDEHLARLSHRREHGAV